jgi:hypothetical protein
MGSPNLTNDPWMVWWVCGCGGCGALRSRRNDATRGLATSTLTSPPKCPPPPPHPLPHRRIYLFFMNALWVFVPLVLLYDRCARGGAGRRVEQRRRHRRAARERDDLQHLPHSHDLT